ncbi:MAG: protein-L-isoaspartate(D-aspartate) O-methyltransferase [Candidatus Aminicenantaceae bacterium]
MRIDFKAERERMVSEQIEARSIKNKSVLEVVRHVPRHLFVPKDMQAYAYQDEPLPIGEGQTISQPYIVAYMTEVLQLKGNERILEVGTGSGYQAAILAKLVREVYTIEILRSLSLKAQKTLKKLGYKNIYFEIGNGSLGWEENSPYDAIIVTAAPAKVPKELQEQLKVSGRMIIPVGSMFQELVLITRTAKKFKKKRLLPVRFVPLVSVH